jgi:hypothetical protein
VSTASTTSVGTASAVSVPEDVITPVPVGERCPPVGEKPCLSLIIAGHVDVGKSTLMGHFLVQAGVVENRVVRKFEKESKDIGKASFAFAWVLDQNESEVRRGDSFLCPSMISVRLCPACSAISWGNHGRFAAALHDGKLPLRAAGRAWPQRFCPTNDCRCYSGKGCGVHAHAGCQVTLSCEQADVAVLVVSAIPKEFDAGFGDPAPLGMSDPFGAETPGDRPAYTDSGAAGGGQTKENAILLRSLGVRNIIVAINKMDQVVCIAVCRTSFGRSPSECGLCMWLRWRGRNCVSQSWKQRF